jgi:hypothetical protein
MARMALERVNLILERSKVRRLRRETGASSNSAAVRLLIDKELATRMGLAALQDLRARGALEDVFNRAPRSRK